MPFTQSQGAATRRCDTPPMGLLVDGRGPTVRDTTSCSYTHVSRPQVVQQVAHRFGAVTHTGVHSLPAQQPEDGRPLHGTSSEEGWPGLMRCPFCQTSDSRVVDSREADGGAAIRRRRSCGSCGRRFTTLEAATLLVVKRSGATEPFGREKVIAGVRKACQGRPVDEDALALLAQRVEENVRAAGRAEVSSDDVGRAILGPLRDLDEVAYLRFASVYRAFDSLEDFELEIDALRRDHAGDPVEMAFDVSADASDREAADQPETTAFVESPVSVVT
jgi:transcriptional repressor NrdR